MIVCLMMWYMNYEVVVLMIMGLLMCSLVIWLNGLV